MPFGKGGRWATSLNTGPPARSISPDVGADGDAVIRAARKCCGAEIMRSKKSKNIYIKVQAKELKEPRIMLVTVNHQLAHSPKAIND